MAASPAPAPLDPQLKLDFAPAPGARTQLQALVTLPVAEAQRNAYGFYNLELEGEVLIEGRTYDHFAYRFDVPATQQVAPLALSFARALRPGSFRLELTVRDLQSGRSARLVQPVDVPRLQAASVTEPAPTAVQVRPSGKNYKANFIIG